MVSRKTRRSTRRGKRPLSHHRIVYCTDAMAWLKTQHDLPSLVTSIPDATEIGMSDSVAYEAFFREAARLCLAATDARGYTIFLQTDRKQNGWMSKAYWVADEAAKMGVRMIWHKIALRTDVGKSDLFRPTYSHMLCFSRKGKVGEAQPNVVWRGPVTYENAFGAAAVEFVLRYLQARGVQSVVDPFVGSGTTLAIANRLGLSAVGVDIDPIQCKKARALVL